MVILCFALSNVWEDFVSNDGQVHNIDFAATTDVDDENLTEITALHLLVGGIGITFSGWFFRKRRNEDKNHDCQEDEVD